MRRTLINFSTNDRVLLGTAHMPQHPVTPFHGLGLLLVNAGPAPRAGNSDLSVHICDHLARNGLPCFRFDLHGLGDSGGPPWPDTRTYWRSAQHGGNDDDIRLLIDHLCESHALDAIIVGGLCAGAICAIRASGVTSDRLAGFILLEPNFRLSPETGRQPDSTSPSLATSSRATPGKKRRRPPLRRRIRRLFNFNELLRILTGDGPAARVASPLRPALQRLLARRIGSILPDDILLPVVMMWEHAIERPVPALVVLARGLSAHRYFTRIVEALPGFRHESIHRVLLDGTSHILTMGDARRQAIAAIEEWLRRTFPTALRPAPSLPLAAAPLPPSPPSVPSPPSQTLPHTPTPPAVLPTGSMAAASSRAVAATSTPVPLPSTSTASTRSRL